MIHHHDDSSVRHAMRFAYAVACNSPDRSTQHGAVVYKHDGRVLGIGWNDFTHGMPVTEDLHERPRKYAFTEHAERNAIYDCVGRAGSPHAMAVTWAPCADCARGIAQSRIKVLYRHVHHEVADRWTESVAYGEQIMRAAGVEIVDIHGELGGCNPIRFDGELWTP